MKRKTVPWYLWTIITLILLPALYIASFGPASWMVDREWISAAPFERFYVPLFLCSPEWLDEALLKYSQLFAPPFAREVNHLWFAARPIREPMQPLDGI